MKFQLSKKQKIYSSSLIAAVVLFLAISRGVSTGQSIAQASIVSQTAKNLAQSLQYFYQDQNRYPTAEEFGEQNIMLEYMSSYPPPSYISANCSQSFSYNRTAEDSFELEFCLPTAFGTYEKGWNDINGDPGQKFD